MALNNLILALQCMLIILQYRYPGIDAKTVTGAIVTGATVTGVTVEQESSTDSPLVVETVTESVVVVEPKEDPKVVAGRLVHKELGLTVGVTKTNITDVSKELAKSRQSRTVIGKKMTDLATLITAGEDGSKETRNNFEGFDRKLTEMEAKLARLINVTIQRRREEVLANLSTLDQYVCPHEGNVTLNYKDKSTDFFCTKDYRGGMVIMRRKTSNVDFYKGWDHYVRGFGDINGDFWLGLEKIYAILSKGRFRLRIKFKAFSEEPSYILYDDFVINGPEDNYRLVSVGETVRPEGPAGDAFRLVGTTPQVGAQFSTKDRDNDSESDLNCAVAHRGAWWFSSCSDTQPAGASLNGELVQFKEGFEKKRRGIRWNAWDDMVHYMKFVEMKLSPASAHS